MVTDSAVYSVGHAVVIIKDKKIFARGKAIVMKGIDFVSIRLEKEDFEKAFAETSEMTKAVLNSIGHIRFFPVSGVYISAGLDLGDVDNAIIDDQFINTRVVDHFNLRFGMVPDFFKDVEDYGVGLPETIEE